MECMVQPLDSEDYDVRKRRIRRFIESVFGTWPEGLTVVVADAKVITTMTAEQRQAIIVAHAEVHRRWPAIFHGFNGAGEAVWRPRHGCADNDPE